jgi:hypothetical protein
VGATGPHAGDHGSHGASGSGSDHRLTASIDLGKPGLLGQIQTSTVETNEFIRRRRTCDIQVRNKAHGHPSDPSVSRRPFPAGAERDENPHRYNDGR